MLKSNFEYQHLFHSFPKEKNKVDAVLNFDLLYKDCFNSQNNKIMQMRFIIHLTYYKTCQYLIIR